MFYTQNNYINSILYKNLNAYRFVIATQRSYALALQKFIESLSKFDHIPRLTYVQQKFYSTGTATLKY